MGYGVSHVNEPNVSLIDGALPLPRKHTAQIGYKYVVNDKLELLPNAYGLLQQDFLQIMGSLQAKYKFLIVGGGFGTNNTWLTMTGVKFKKWRILYSYDKTVSKLTNRKAGSHEVTLQLMLHITKKDNEKAFLLY